VTASAQAFCAKCGAVAEEGGQMPRVACENCGSLARKFDVSIHAGGVTARVGMAYKAKHEGATGKRKWHFEAKSIWSFFSKTEEWHHISRSVDRENDQYIEHIVDEAGNVVRSVDEPLSEHKGRGDAKL
jgi:predicted  nucleic acid-binding Zn-ribbon protein